MKLTGRDFVLYFSIIYKGNWDCIMNAIQKRENPQTDEVVRVINSIKTKFVTILDADYPEALKEIYKPPFVLFYKGDISIIQNYRKCMAVVGAREPTTYGLENMNLILKDVVKDYVFVSGCALGIDAHAHELSLKYGGKTVGILGCGLDVDYPKQNFELKERIAKDHLLMSEYPDGTPPSQENFPIRNRIIVGISKSVFIVDCKHMSGTLSTANLASQLNRDLMSFPYPMNMDYINNSLIKMGCFLIENGEDVRTVMGH